MVSTMGPTASTTGNEGQVETGRNSSTEGEAEAAGSECNRGDTHASSSQPGARPCVPERALDGSAHGSDNSQDLVQPRNTHTRLFDSNPR